MKKSLIIVIPMLAMLTALLFTGCTKTSDDEELTQEQEYDRSLPPNKLMVTLTTNAQINKNFTLSVAAWQPIFIDWGDGKKVEYDFEYNKINEKKITGTIKSNSVKIYARYYEAVLSLDLESLQLSEIDASECSDLAILTARSNQLKSIKLSPKNKLGFVNIWLNELKQSEIDKLLNMLPTRPVDNKGRVYLRQSGNSAEKNEDASSNVKANTINKNWQLIYN